MKIPLNLQQNGTQSSKAAQAKALERDIKASKKGDWNAKHNLVRTFTPLLTSLAQKRAKDVVQVNAYIEAGKAGLFQAVRKYKSNIGPGKFQVFALDFIERSMDRAAKGQNPAGGFFSRLLSR